MRVNLDTLVWDKYVYPRQKKSNVTVNAYAEAMSIGAEFPLIEVQRVSDYKGEARNYKAEDILEILRWQDNQALLIIDGVHRWIAYHQYNDAEKKQAKKQGREPKLIEEVEVTEWQPDIILDYAEHKIDLTLEAAERNTQHGDRIGESDKREKARQIAFDDPERKYTEELVAKKLGVAYRQRVNEWTSDIRARQKASRNSKIVRLVRLGWAQEEIAVIAGIKQNRVSQIINNAEFGEIDKMLSEGRSMKEIASHYSIDLALAWALRLEGKDDIHRFRGDVPPGTDTKDLEELGWGIRTWDDWYFEDCDPRFGDDWDGRIPAQLVAHTLFYFTHQGDLVMDPMAGGGVVPDVCLAFERKCRAFDMVARPERPEIEKHYWDSENVQWPEMKKKPDLIFFDPPYFTKKAREYEEKAQQEPDQIPISSLPREEYLAFFERFFKLAYENTKDTTRLAFLNADWRDFQSTPALEENPDNAVTIFDYGRLLSAAEWQVTHIIECRLSTGRMGGGVVKAMQEARILGTIRRTLLIARKRTTDG